MFKSGLRTEIEIYLRPYARSCIFGHSDAHMAAPLLSDATYAADGDPEEHLRQRSARAISSVSRLLCCRLSGLMTDYWSWLT